MNFLRKHWYDVAPCLAAVVLVFLATRYQHLTRYQVVLWLSVASLFLHQWEEYRLAGTFPGMINAVLFKSAAPDRYPLNTNSAFLINVGVGWTCYILAAVLAQKAVWLGVATLIVSLGNTLAHAVLFNVKGKTFYNAGMFTALFLFVPCTVYCFFTMHREQLATTADYIVGILLGLLITVVGIVKPIVWLADKNAGYYFDPRQVLPRNRAKAAALQAGTAGRIATPPDALL